MLFTRQPIVETIITPKEGYQLQLKSSSNAVEHYLADALELVIYGTIPFYRSLEGPRPFLVPAARFEVEQIREARIPLKHAPYERKAARESIPREAKKNSLQIRERSSAKREEKAEAAGNNSENWERRKHPRKRVSNTAVAAAPQELDKISDQTKAPSSAEIYEAFRYDLVPPPETFVADSMENLQKSRQKAAEISETGKSNQNSNNAPLDAVEAILQEPNYEIPPNEPPIG